MKISLTWKTLGFENNREFSLNFYLEHAEISTVQLHYKNLTSIVERIIKFKALAIGNNVELVFTNPKTNPNFNSIIKSDGEIVSFYVCSVDNGAEIFKVVCTYQECKDVLWELYDNVTNSEFDSMMSEFYTNNELFVEKYKKTYDMNYFLLCCTEENFHSVSHKVKDILMKKYSLKPNF